MIEFPEIVSSILSSAGNYFSISVPLLLISQVAFFSLFMVNGRNATIDCGWVFNHFLVGLFLATNSFNNIPALLNSPKDLISIGLLAFWMLRLGGHLFTHRVWKAHTDSRYTAMMKSATGFKKIIKYFIQYMLQGLLASITAIPLYFLFKNGSTIGSSQITGWILSLVGIIGQAISDNQLEKFKKKKISGGLLREGLWKKSRHPNLFFELATWFGFALAGYNIPSDFIAIIGPLFLWFVMSGLTIPITEKCMKRLRPGTWEKYVSETNKYWPF